MRGLGAMLAIELVTDRETKEPAAELVSRTIAEALDRGLLLKGSGTSSNVIRFLPPLNHRGRAARPRLSLLEESLVAAGATRRPRLVRVRVSRRRRSSSMRTRPSRKAVSLIEEAAANGAELVAFAESWLPGYPSRIFVPPVGRGRFRRKGGLCRFRENAIAVPSALTERSAARSRGRRRGRDGHDGARHRHLGGLALQHAALLLGRRAILGVHRKLMPTHAERIVWGQGDGSGLLVVETGVGKVGGLICWEHWMPLARFAMHAKGEQVHAAVWPDDPEMHLVASRRTPSRAAASRSA